MEKGKLKQLCGLKLEIEALEEELAEANKAVKRREYIFGAYRLIGDGLDEVRRIESALMDKHHDYLSVLDSCTDFIETIPEPDIRVIFHRRYVLGQRWQKIAFAVGAVCEATPRKRHDRYLQRVVGL